MSKKATSDIKSGAVSVKEYVVIQGGMPETKKIEAINKANEPKKAPGSV